ncbi:hypothetical protein PoB_000741400 [Plakobranchus ocellatus]|uniref:Uncharacterized protein n=1 Tax=Plakobranchus ocellatus TaxID=259542 RepID=A0AAV3YD10_9GAST|nr:hypothetical protein PoB_000741400 [Plakobranchus ocellatus]
MRSAGTLLSPMRAPPSAPQLDVYKKVISGFQALREARAPVVRLEPATEGSADLRADSLAIVLPTPADNQ